MSQYYYQQQRKEDITSLQSMFGPPWTFDLLGGVLDYYNGNVDEAVSKLLILNEHHKGNPQSLVENLLLSSVHKMPAPATKPPATSRRKKNGTMATIPKSMLKKAPPPRRVQVAVTMADTFEPAVITIDKQTRRRVGIPMKLPVDFLRIPKTPLFAMNHLDHLIDFSPSEPLRQSSSKSPESSTAHSSTHHQQQGGTPTKFQALRASMNFPTFQKNDSNNVQKDRKSNGTATPTKTMLSNFSVPKITAPTLTIPKLPRLSTPGRNNNIKPSPPGSPAGPPAELFASANQDGDWFALTQPPAAARSQKTAPPPESAPPPAAAATVAENNSFRSRWNLSGVNTPSRMKKGIENGKNNTIPEPTASTTTPRENGSRWSLASMGTPSSLTKKPSPQQQNATPSAGTPKSEKSVNTASGWNFSSMSSSLKTPPSLSRLRANSTDRTAPAQEQAVPQEKASNRWSLPAIGSSMMMTTKQRQSDGLGAVVASDEPNQENYGAIPQIEYRGITVRQLRNLVRDVRHQCVNEQWRSTESGKSIQPGQVTMYDLVKHFILPRTQANSCSFVEAAFGQHHYEDGLRRPPQWFVSHAWSDSMFHVVDCIEQHAADRGLDADADTAIYWICALAMNQHSTGASISIETINESSLQNPLMTKNVMNVTEGILSVIDKENVYYKRIWCIWELFLALERAKASCHGDGDHYLVDIYTTNEDAKVVGLTDGAVESDKHRLSSNQETKKAEKSPLSGKKESFLFQKQPCNKLEWSELRTLRQSQFRFQSCTEALDVQLESAHACLEEDTRRIMNCVVQYNTNGNDIHSARAHDSEALTVHPGYSHVNALIQGAFAGMAYRCALEDSVGEKAGDQEHELLRKVQTALSTSPVENLEMSFAGCAAFQIREALKLVESLPTSLRRLDLDYSFLEFQYAEEFAIGFGRLSDNLQVFKLNCAYCSKLENLDRLWEELGKLVNLRHLVLVIHPNKKLISVDGLATALNNMPKLESLELEFDCYGEYSKMVAMAKGGATLNNISSTYRNMLGKSSDSSRRTKELYQQFDRVSKLANLDIGGAYISDSSIQKLCRTLTSRTQDTKLTSFKLRFLGDLGKKLRSVETIDDLQQTLKRIRTGLKLFS